MALSRQKPARFLIIAVTVVSAALPLLIHAAPGPDENLSSQISGKKDEIRRLEEEAQKYRETLTDIGRQAETLQNRVKTLDGAINRTSANIRVTNAKISLTALEIKELEEDIKEKEGEVIQKRAELSHLVGILAEGDRQTPLEIIIKNKTISSFFAAMDGIVSVQRDFQFILKELRDAREELKNKKGEDERKKFELTNLADNLSDQKALQEYERKERSNLLIETKSQEKRYQELLADLERKRDALQQEINLLESSLKDNFDRSLLPKAGNGILGWPLPDPIFITQYFGNTSFSRSGAYNGKGHNGIDFRAAVGTPVFVSEQGTVRATGDTDTACRRASYGRWILVDHNNNLSTLYAHMSLIKVQSGDVVNRGELLGYSGKTGYATGPHLHLTVFARQAVQVGELKSRTCGRIMTLPMSPFGGYLNPLGYL